MFNAAFPWLLTFCWVTAAGWTTSLPRSAPPPAACAAWTSSWLWFEVLWFNVCVFVLLFVRVAHGHHLPSWHGILG